MVLLITQAQVIEKAISHLNTNKALIKDDLIRATQEDYMRPVLNDLYPVLLAEVKAGSISTANQTLLDDHIIPTLAFYVKANLLPDLSLPQTSAGVVQLTNEHSTPVTNQQRSDLVKKALDIGNSLRDVMVRFLEDEDNADDYPDFKPTQNIQKQITNFGGIVVDTPVIESTKPDNQ